MLSGKIDFSPFLCRLRNFIQTAQRIRDVKIDKMLPRHLAHPADIRVIEQKYFNAQMRICFHHFPRQLLCAVIQTFHIYHFFQCLITDNRAVQVNAGSVARQQLSIRSRCRTRSSGRQREISAVLRKILQCLDRLPLNRMRIVQQGSVHIRGDKNTVKLAHTDSSISVRLFQNIPGAVPQTACAHRSPDASIPARLRAGTVPVISTCPSPVHTADHR